MFTLRFDMRAPVDGVPISDLYTTAIEMSEWAERHGAASVLISEHHTSSDRYIPSPMILAAAIAARTSTIPISIGALLLNFYDPIKLAEDMAVLDIVSGGRVAYIIGLGYRPEEHAMFGVAMSQRGATMDRTLDALLRALRGERFEYEGRQVYVTPGPLSEHTPFVAYGGHTVAAAKRAGRFGLGLFAEGPNPQLEPTYLEAAAAAGKTPSMVMVPGGTAAPTSAFVSTDVDSAWERWGPYLLHDANMYAAWLGDERPTSWSGASTVDELRAENGPYRIFTPDQAVEQIRTNGMLGLHPMCGGLPPAYAWESLRAIETEVLPKLALR